MKESVDRGGRGQLCATHTFFQPFGPIFRGSFHWLMVIERRAALQSHSRYISTALQPSLEKLARRLCLHGHAGGAGPLAAVLLIATADIVLFFKGFFPFKNAVPSYSEAPGQRHYRHADQR